MSPSTSPSTMPCGLRVAADERNPAANSARKRSAETMLKRGPLASFVDSWRRRRFLAMTTGTAAMLVTLLGSACFEVSDHLVDGEADGVRLGEQPVAQQAECAFFVARRLLGDRIVTGVTNEGADAALGGEDATSLELRVNLGHGVGVDAQVDRQLPNRRQPVAGGEVSGCDRGPDGAVELGIDRRGVRGVDAEHNVRAIILVF